MNKVTDRFRLIVARAEAIATGMGDYANSQHLLAAILEQPNSVATGALKNLGITGEAIHAEIRKILGEDKWL